MITWLVYRLPRCLLTLRTVTSGPKVAQQCTRSKQGRIAAMRLPRAVSQSSLQAAMPSYGIVFLTADCLFGLVVCFR